MPAMSSIYSIYRATNLINGKSYIGFDSNWPSRMYSHYYISSSNKKQHFHIHHAIKKYGWENFNFEVIYQSQDREHTLNIMEPYFIKEYNTFDSGYNQTLGGEGSFGKIQSEENKIKQSNLRKKMNINSKWYNNGYKNKFCENYPGDSWILGRLNQKPTTTGYKWYTNGKEQKLTNNPPEGWVKGMLPKKMP